MAQPDGAGQFEPLPQEWQPQLSATGIAPGLKTSHDHQLLNLALAAADGGEIRHAPELRVPQRQQLCQRSCQWQRQLFCLP